jgi:hypothetical protein
MQNKVEEFVSIENFKQSNPKIFAEIMNSINNEGIILISGNKRFDINNDKSMNLDKVISQSFETPNNIPTITNLTDKMKKNENNVTVQQKNVFKNKH